MKKGGGKTRPLCFLADSDLLPVGLDAAEDGLAVVAVDDFPALKTRKAVPRKAPPF